MAKAKLDNPIDVMMLIHKALRAEAGRVEQLADDLVTGDRLQRFRLAFNSWATALVYQVELEQRYLMTPLANFSPSGRYKREHTETGKPPAIRTSPPTDDDPGLEEGVRAAMVALGDKAYRALVETAQDVLTVLDKEIGKTSLITRTKQHIYLQVVALRIAQEDHLETEEALILPTVRRRMSERQQLEIAKSLLIDGEAENPRWIIDWMVPHLNSGENGLLADLEERFNEMPMLASEGV